MIQTAASVAPRHVAASSGRAVRVLGDRVTYKAIAPETVRPDSLYETSKAPRAECPPHTHRYDDETRHVHESRYAVLMRE